MGESAIRCYWGDICLFMPEKNPVLLFCSFTFICIDLATRNSIVLTTTTCSKVTCLLDLVTSLVVDIQGLTSVWVWKNGRDERVEQRQIIESRENPSI
jgi:hypothetical protein